MRIFHYTIGLAPQRSGGLTKYATDLMQEQQVENQVFLLYPSGSRWWSNKIYWRKDVVSAGGIQTIKLKNSLPVPLLYGVKSPKDFISQGQMSVDTMEKLYYTIRPDIFHVHTLMGLPKELLLFFKSKGVKLIYTSHDYFGLCPKVNFIDAEGALCSLASESNCFKCNLKAPSTFFLRLRNSCFALNIKNNPFLRKLLR